MGARSRGETGLKAFSHADALPSPAAAPRGLQLRHPGVGALPHHSALLRLARPGSGPELAPLSVARSVSLCLDCVVLSFQPPLV